MDIKKKIFYIFIVLHAILWSCLQLLRNIVSIDSMEAISWGQLISFGTNKHPPLSGWLMAGFYNLFGEYDILVYILGQLCLVVGFIYVYKLAKFFISQEKAFCASMILEFCFYYTYGIFIDNFNCNVVLMGFWPIVAYYFYKSVSENSLKDWLIFGIVSGLAFLGKYQIVFLFLGMLFYLIFANRQQFKRFGLYLSIFAGTLVILPHVIWLFQNDFFSFAYMIERTDSVTHNMPVVLAKLSHLVYPIKFIGDQILAVLPCVAVYLLLVLYAKIKMKNSLSLNESEQCHTDIAQNSLFEKKVDILSPDSIFLLSIGVIPILAHGFMGVVTGSRVPGIWGSIMVSSIGILLFYFFPIKFNKDSFIYFAKWAYAGLFGSLIGVGIFGILQTKPFIAFPKERVMDDFDKIWMRETNNAPFKYAAGDMDYIFQFNIYNKNHPRIILETFGHKNPWVNHEDVLKSGVLVIGEDDEDVINRAKEAVYLLPDDYEITPKTYTMDICNKLGNCVEKEISYVVIPGVK